MSIEKVIVYGAGGFGRELAWLAVEAGCEVACFADDGTSVSASSDQQESPRLNELLVLPLQDAAQRFPDAAFVVGVGSPASRRQMTERALKAGLKARQLIHPLTRHSKFVSFGDGVVICAGNTLTTNISIGRQVQINLHCTVGHDVRIGEFTTLSPGVNVSGCVHIGTDVYVGTGAAIINGTQQRPLTIGDGAIIGAGACVVRDVSPGVTVVGVPARPIERR